MAQQLPPLLLPRGKRDRDEEPPLDDGTGPLRFYCSKKDGVGPGATPLLNERDRNGPRAILGNFANYPLTVVYNDQPYQYPTAEHAYQALKYLVLANREVDPALKEAHIRFANVVGSAKTANRAYLLALLKEKKAGGLNTAGGADRTFANSPDQFEMQRAYDAGVRSAGALLSVGEKLTIMEAVLYSKFVNNADRRARDYLLSTGTRELVEHTTRDNLWGDGGDGTGANLLGQTLMKIRSMLSNLA